jgi:tetratricopeptide (TPR) repeat protein
MHLLRTGDEVGAREALERSFADDPFDVITYNLLGMMDTLDEFETFERGDVIVRLHPSEADILKDYVIDLAQEALDTLSILYNLQVEGPILIEIFPRHDDFAVRNLGLPGMIGALGACFGKVVTMDSPRARPPGDFNWRATLWHEIAHVITLQMSRQRVPRWLTEGISVYEEQRARTAWGRDQELVFAQALNEDRVLLLQDLNSGFSKPETISLSYFQASVLVEHIVDYYGEPVLHELVSSYGEGLETDEALTSVGLDFETLQITFDEAIDKRFGDLRQALLPIKEEERIDSSEKSEQDPAERLENKRALAVEYPGRFAVQFSLGKALYEAGELDAALVPLERAVALAPMATGIDSPRGLLAAIAQEQSDQERAMRELELLLQHDQTSLEAARQLAALAEEADDEDRMNLAYDRVIGIDPFDPVPHLAIGRMALARGDAVTSIREFQIALAADPVDRVSAYCDLSESYLMAGEFENAKRSVLAALEMAPTYERAQELLLRVVEEES